MPSNVSPNSVVQPGSGKSSTGADTASVIAAVAAITAHVTDPVGAHAATAINYEAGPNWLGGRTNPATTAQAQLSKIISDLAATTASDDGVERIGAEGVVGVPSSLTIGSNRSQLSELLTHINARARKASSEDISGDWIFTAAIEVDFNTAFGPLAEGCLFWRQSALTDADTSFGPSSATVMGSDEYNVPAIGANRIYTFTATAPRVNNVRVRVIRLGTEAFSVTIKQNGGTDIAQINAGAAGWLEFIYRGANWHLSAWGGGVTILLAT